MTLTGTYMANNRKSNYASTHFYTTMNLVCDLSKLKDVDSKNF